MKARGLLFAICGAASLLAGCSHTGSPFIRPSLVSSNWIKPELEKIATRLVLVGDAGNHDRADDFLACLRRYAAELPQRTVVIFLGDNTYEEGMPLPGDARYGDATNRLRQQLLAAEPARDTIFIPGNHDWKHGVGGLRRQRLFVQAAGRTFYPADGGYGPVVDERFSEMRLVALDSQQLKRSADSEAIDEAMVQLQQAVSTNLQQRHVVVLAHHPLATHGIHGGFYDWRRWLFNAEPFRIGGFNMPGIWIPIPGPYVVGRTWPRRPDDLRSSEYQTFVSRVTSALERNKPLVYAAGHDHSLQVLEGGRASEYMLVSGLGSPGKETTVTDGRDTLFAHLQPGFVLLDFMVDRKVLLRVIEPADTQTDQVVFSQWLSK